MLRRRGKHAESDVDTDAPGAGLHANPTQDGRGTLRIPTSRKIFFAAATVAWVLLTAEFGARLLGLGPAVEVAEYMSVWPDMPGDRPFWVVRGVGFNRHGLRDRDHPLQKPPGTFRIACLGDSVTYGHDLRRGQNFTTLLEQYLRQIGVEAEVMNVAIPGWSTLQEAAAYEELVRPYRPDHVILGFCLNDVAEMQNNLTRPPRLAAFLASHSALVRWAANPRGRQVADVLQLLNEPDSPPVRGGWARVFEELERITRYAAEDGSEFSIIMFPFRLQLEEGAPAPTAQKTLYDYCMARRIPCLDLLPALRPIGPEAFIDDSHLSAAGSSAVAAELVRWGRTGCWLCGLDLADVKEARCPRCGEPIRE